MICFCGFDTRSAPQFHRTRKNKALDVLAFHLTSEHGGTVCPCGAMTVVYSSTLHYRKLARDYRSAWLLHLRQVASKEDIEAHLAFHALAPAKRKP